MCYNVKQKKNERATMLQGMNFIPHNTTAKTSSFIFRYSLYSLNEKKIKGRSFNRLSVFFFRRKNKRRNDEKRKTRDMQKIWRNEEMKGITTDLMSPIIKNNLFSGNYRILNLLHSPLVIYCFCRLVFFWTSLSFVRFYHSVEVWVAEFISRFLLNILMILSRR